MEKQIDKNTEVLCRACLELLQDDACCVKHDIFITPDLAKKLIVCTSLTVEAQDGFPKYLCQCCFNKVNEFHEFQTMCVESVQRFQEILQRQGEKYFHYEDEKPEFDLEETDKLEITIAEPEILFKQTRNSMTPADELEVDALEAVPFVRRSGRAKGTKEVEAVLTLGEKCSRKRKRSQRLNKDYKDSELQEAQMQIVSQVDTRDTSNSDSGHDHDAWRASEEHELVAEKEDTISEMEFVSQKHRRRKDITKVKHRVRSKRRGHKRIGASSDFESKPPRKKSEIYQCDICPTRFFVEHRLIAHKRTHDGLMPYPCSVEGCDKAFNRWHCLNTHLKQHAGTSQWYTCSEAGCDKVYKHKPTLSMHLRKFHKKGPELKSHVCEICGKVFKASAILNDHRYTHKDKSELPHACPEPNCDRRFSTKEKLKVHGMRHAGIKNYVCPYCGLRKTTRNELKIHINYHTLERTWPCRFCQHVCNSAGNLKMHVRTVHERAKDYACRFCERTFAKPDTRKYHEMTHTGEKPNECKVCGKRFTQPAALRTHSKIHTRHRAQGVVLQEAAENDDGGALTACSNNNNNSASLSLLNSEPRLMTMSQQGTNESLMESAEEAEAVETMHLQNLLQDNL